MRPLILIAILVLTACQSTSLYKALSTNTVTLEWEVKKEDMKYMVVGKGGPTATCEPYSQWIGKQLENKFTFEIPVQAHQIQCTFNSAFLPTRLTCIPDADAFGGIECRAVGKGKAKIKIIKN